MRIVTPAETQFGYSTPTPVLCEEICRLCADECGVHDHDHCQQCAAACLECDEHYQPITQD